MKNHLRVAIDPRLRGLTITAHAVDRYVERVRPTLTDKQEARKELVRLVAEHGRVGDRPAWAHDPPPGVDVEAMRAEAIFWVHIGDTIACPVSVGKHLMTVVHQGGLSEAARIKRNERRARRTKARRTRQIMANRYGDKKQRDQ